MLGKTLITKQTGEMGRPCNEVSTAYFYGCKSNMQSNNSLTIYYEVIKICIRRLEDEKEQFY